MTRFTFGSVAGNNGVLDWLFCSFIPFLDFVADYERVLTNGSPTSFFSFARVRVSAGFREMNCCNIDGTKVKYISFNQDYSACIVVNDDGYKIVSLLPTAAPVDPTKDVIKETMRQNMEQEG